MVSHRIKVRSRERLSARKWNRVVDASRTGRIGNSAGVVLPDSFQLPAEVDPDSGANSLEEFKVVTITGARRQNEAEKHEVLQNIVLTVDQPAFGLANQNFAITTQTFSKGDVASVVLSGACVARVIGIEDGDEGDFVYLPYDQDLTENTSFPGGSDLRVWKDRGVPAMPTWSGTCVGRVVQKIERPLFTGDLAVVALGPEQQPGYYVLFGGATARSGSNAGSAGGEIQNKAYEGSGVTLDALNWTTCAFTNRYFQVARDQFGVWHFAGFDDEV